MYVFDKDLRKSETAIVVSLKENALARKAIRNEPSGLRYVSTCHTEPKVRHLACCAPTNKSTMLHSGSDLNTDLDLAAHHADVLALNLEVGTRLLSAGERRQISSSNVRGRDQHERQQT